MVTTSHEKVVVVPDMHFPYHDRKFFKLLNNFIIDQEPDRVVIIGDFVDMYAVSRFDKNPKRANKLQEEIDSAIVGLETLVESCGTANIKYVEGNHEERLKKFLWRHPDISGLRHLTIPSLLNLDEFGIDYVTEWFWKDTFLFTHGRRLGVNAARAELLDRGVSGISGHTHRLGSFTKTDYYGEKVWHSVGHGCDPSMAEYVFRPDWVQGVGVAYLSRSSKRFFVSTIPVAEHKIIYDGKLYSDRSVRKL